MSGHQTAGQNLNTEPVNKLFGNVVEVTYWYRDYETKLHSEITLVWIIIHGKLAVIQFIMFCLPICYLKT